MVRCPRCGLRLREAAPFCPHHGAPPVVEASGSVESSPGSHEDPAFPALRSSLAAAGFEVRGVLGRGGFGAVYRARKQSDGREVAIKVALPEQIDGVGRLAREADAIEMVGPPSVPVIYGRGPLGPSQYFVALECIDAPTLADRLVAAAGPMALERFADYAAALLRPLEAIHSRRIVHRDLKPENIFIDNDARAKVIDFGLAKHLDDPARKGEGNTASGGDDDMGTAEYMSPEQCDGAADTDLRSDIYSAGVLLYEMLSGSPPFWGSAADVREAQRSRRPPVLSAKVACPPELDQLIRRCLSKDRERRFADAPTLRRALEGVLANIATWEPASRTRPSVSPVFTQGPAAAAAAAPKAAPAAARDKRTMGLVFFESTSGIGAVQPVLAASGGQVVQTNGAQYVAAFGHDVGDNPARSALMAAQRLLLADLTTKLLVDIASVSVQVRPDGSRRFFSAVFSKKDRFPGAADSTGVCLTQAAAEVISDVAVLPVPGRADRLRLDPHAEAEEDSTSYGLRSAASVGREDVLNRLMESAKHALIGSEPTLATIVGEAGHGRTHLGGAFAYQLLNVIPTVDVIKLTAQEAIVGAVSPTLHDLLHRLLSLPDKAPPDDGHALFVERLGSSVGEQVWPAAAFAAGWITADHPQLRAVAAAPGALRLAASRAVGEALRYRARAQPIAVVLDDAHLADEVTLDALEYATLREAGMRVWACVLVRPQFDKGRPTWATRAARADRIILGPLRPQDASELARRLLHPVEHVPPAALTLLADRTQGVPRLLVELVRGLKRDGLVRRSERGTGHYLATDELEKLPDLPVVQWNASREIEALPTQVAGHARLSSVLGANFALEDVEGLLQILEQEDDLEDMQLDANVGVQRLLDVGVLIRHRTGLLDFRHPLLRETVYQLVPDAQRKKLHRAAFTFYQRLTSMPDERRLPRLALHAARSGAHDEAAATYLTLAERALQAHAYLEAEASFGRALENLTARDGKDGAGAKDERTIEAARGRGLMRFRLGRHEDALVDLRHARELAHARGATDREIDLLLDEATVLDWTRDFEQSAALVNDVDTMTRAKGDRSPLLAARLAMSMGRIHHRRGEQETSIRLGAEAATMADRLGGDGYETFVISLLMVAPDCANQGRLEEAETFFDQVLAAAESHADLHHVAAACVNRAFLWFARKDTERLFGDLTRATQIARETGSPLIEYFALYNMGEAEYAIERLDQATEHTRRAIEITRQLWGDQSRELATRELLLARIALYRNDLKEARRLVDRIRARSTHGGGGAESELAASDRALLEMVDLGSRTAPETEWETFATTWSGIELQPLEEVELLEARGLTAARAGDLETSRRFLNDAIELSGRKPNLMSKRVERHFEALCG